MWQKPKKAENDRLKQAQGTISAGGSYRRYSMNQSGKIQQYIEKHKRKTLNGAKLVKGFYGAPNRIRTCGLLIRSQTLYPAELWVQSSFFCSGHLERKWLYRELRRMSILFWKIFSIFLPCARNAEFLQKPERLLGDERRRGKSERKMNFFLVQTRKKRRKPGKSEMKENGRQRNETSDVSERKTVDKMRYPQLEDKNAGSSVDNCG